MTAERPRARLMLMALPLVLLAAVGAWGAFAKGNTAVGVALLVLGLAFVAAAAAPRPQTGDSLRPYVVWTTLGFAIVATAMFVLAIVVDEPIRYLMGAGAAAGLLVSAICGYALWKGRDKDIRHL